MYAIKKHISLFQFIFMFLQYFFFFFTNCFLFEIKVLRKIKKKLTKKHAAAAKFEILYNHILCKTSLYMIVRSSINFAKVII